MQTWAKRGLHTALVTGSLLMLGTGIASADEDVDPDRPASPLDASVTVPVKIDNNGLGTPYGQTDLPEVRHQLTATPGDLFDAAPAGSRLAPVREQLAPKAHSAMRGNSAAGNVVVPVDASGNAVAALGDVEVANDSTQHVRTTREITVDSGGRGLAGNAVSLAYALPVQVTGNAASAGGTAVTHNTAEQSATADGGIATSGQDGALSGNLAAGHAATPVQLNGNAITGGGVAAANSATGSSAAAGGSTLTDGQDSTLSGNAAGVPVAMPVRTSGQALGLAGNADATSTTGTRAQAGADREGLHGVPTYIETNGGPATLAGNIAQPAVSGPLALDCNSAGGAGNADSGCATRTTTAAGGGSRSTGQDAVLSGAIVGAPVSAPVQGMGNTGAVVGNTTAAQDNAVSTDAGGETYTRGHDGIASGSVVSTPVSGPADLCGNVTGGLGQGGVVCATAASTTAGGNTGTTGSDSIAGGNGAVVPVALPLKGVGNTSGVAGDTTTAVGETRETTAGGNNNTDDDAALLAANLVQVPVSGPVQAFGNGAGAAANTASDSAIDESVAAGGDSRSKGRLGTLSGNIAQVPVSSPAQLFGAGATALGEGAHAAHNSTGSAAGGQATTDGFDGTGSGNVLSAPVGSTVQGFGASATAAGDNTAEAHSVTGSAAGGPTTTSGRHGKLAGNVVSPQALPLAQVFADSAAGVAGTGRGSESSDTTGHAGGPIATDGQDGFLSGNLFDVPAAGLAQTHGNAGSALASEAVGSSHNTTGGAVGGPSTTRGDLGELSGVDLSAPVGVEAPVYEVPVAVLADAMAEATHESDVSVGEEEKPQLRLPAPGALEVTQVPKLPSVFRAPSTQRSGHPQVDPLTSLLGGLRDGLPPGGLLGVVNSVSLGPIRDGVDTLTGNLPVGGLGEATPIDQVAGLLPDGSRAQVHEVPEVDRSLGGLPALDGLLGSLPLAGLLGDGNPLGAADGLLGTLPLGSLTGGGLPVVGGQAARRDAPLSVGQNMPLGGLPGLGGLGSNLPAGDLPQVVQNLTEAVALDGVTDALGGLTGGAAPRSLPAAGDLPLVGELPVGGDLPLGGLSGTLGDATRTLDSLTDTLPLGTLPLGTLPLGGLSGLLPGGLPVGARSLPTGGLPGGVAPVGDLVDDLPLAVPAHELPGGDLLDTRTLPPVGDLVDDLGDTASAHTMPIEGLSGLRSLPVRELADELGGSVHVQPGRDLFAAAPARQLPNGGLTDSLALGGLGGAVTGLTKVVNGVSQSLPVGQLTQSLPVGGLGGAPRFAAPATPGLDNVEGVFSGDLFEDATQDHLPVRVPALPGIDTTATLPAAFGDSLTDTRSKLAGLGRHAIG